MVAHSPRTHHAHLPTQQHFNISYIHSSMLRSILLRGVRGAPLFPTTRVSSNRALLTTYTRNYAAAHKAEDPHHAPAAHGDGHQAAAGHHDEHHHDDHHHDHHHKHIDLSDAPYGVLFGEVYQGKRKIPAWEWIYYAGMGATIIVLYFVYKDFDERKIETWAKRTYQQAKLEAETNTANLQQLKKNNEDE